MGINVLILSAGRRVELLQCFQRARDRLKLKGIVAAADCSELAPALYFADEKRIVPRIAEQDDYISSVIDICRELDISLVVPTIDTELLLLARRREQIESETKARVLISDKKVIEICRNKINTQRYLTEEGFLVPRRITEEDLRQGNVTYPVFIKPVSGSSSINAFRADNEKELSAFREIIGEYLIQEFMEGTEYTVDVFLDFRSRLISVVPRIRIATRSGEIAKGRIVRDPEIIENVSELMRRLKPVGHITVQCMRTKKGIEYIEINPRFGGGAPMSIMAGADSCEFLYRQLLGEELDFYDSYRENITFLRFDSSIMLNEELEYESSHL